jgi:histidinol-phosphatase (PHP family)
MHSHHSHSSDFCGHASSSLEDMIELAITKQFKVFCLTEHMPRLKQADLYPEELDLLYTVEHLKQTFNQYYKRAKELQHKYENQIQLLVGFESESISPDYFVYIDELKKEYSFDLVVGSVHHVAGIPIDYDKSTWETAVKAVGTVEDLFEQYFDLQYEMLQRVKPAVVGHFDLIKLYAPSDINMAGWPTVWCKVERNIQLAVGIGAMFEMNSAAIRKGWTVPYPQEDVARVVIERGGQFCLSDDSHCLGHVGSNYDKCLEYLERLGVDRVYYLTREDGEVVKQSELISQLRSNRR